MDSPSQLLLTLPIQEGICKNLTFEEAVKLREALNVSSLDCPVPISDPDHQILFLKGVNDDTIPLYFIIQEVGSTRAMIETVTKNLIQSVKILLDNGANINALDSNENTPLIIAAFNGYVELVQLLLEKGADIYRRNKQDKTALMVTTLEALGQRWRSRNPVLLSRLKEPRLEIAKLLIAAGANVNDYSNVPSEQTVLMEAAGSNYFEMVQLLLDNGVDINYLTSGERSALDKAISSDREEMVQFLLEKGANPDPELVNTPLMEAAVLGNPAIIEILLDFGAKINKHNDEGITALMYAIQFDEYQAVKILLERGANVNLADQNGETALDYAFQSKDPDIAPLIKSYGGI